MARNYSIDSTNKGISERFDKAGRIISLQAKMTLGTAGKYVYLSKTAKLDPALSPAKARAAAKKELEQWVDAQHKQYDEYLSLCAAGEISEAECEDYSLYCKNLELLRQSAARASRARKIAFAEFVNEHWLPDHIHDGQHTPSTIANCEYHVKYLLPYFGEMKMESITTEVLKRYINTLRAEPLSGTSQYHRFNTLRNILRYAFVVDYLAANPLDRLPRSLVPHKEHHKLETGKDFLSPEQVQQYLRCLEEEPPFYRTMVNLMIFTGLRRGEVVGLQWCDIDLDEQTLNVVRNVTKDTKSPAHVHIGKPKTAGSVRTIALPTYLVELLKHWKIEQTARYGLLLPNAYLFSNAEDPYRPLYPTTVTAWVHDFEVRHGLPKVSPHDLRHTAATLALQSGANLKTVQDLLGHADFKTTATYYTGITKEVQHETAAAVEALVFGAS